MYKTILTILIGVTLISFNACKPAVSVSDQHLLKGNNLVLDNDLENAQKEYEMAIKADTTNWRACYELAGVYELTGDFKASYFYFSKAVQLNPKFTLGYYNRSNLEELIGDAKGAEKDLKTVMENKPFYIALLTQGKTDYGKGNLKKSIADLDEAIKARPDFYLAYSIRGSCKYRDGDLKGAISDFDMEVKLNPDNMMGYVNRGVAESENKDFRAAITDMNIALQINPLWSQGYLYRGTFYNSLNVKDSACGDFKMAKKLKNPDAENYLKKFCN